MRKRSFGVGRVWKRQQDGGSIFVGDWKRADGARQRRVLSSDRRVAERMMADIVRTRDLSVAGLAIEDGFDLSAADLIDEFVSDLRARRTKRYAARVEAILKTVRKELGVRTLRDLHPQAFLLFRRRRLADGAANRTVNLELTVTRTMLNWCVRAGYIAFNPLQALQGLPIGRGYERSPRRALNDDEIDRLLAASAQIDQESTGHALATTTITNGTKGAGYAAKERVPTVPQTPLWLTLMETGARFGEAVSACWGDLSDTRRTLTLRANTTKSRRERIIPVRRELLDVLASLRVAQHAVLGRLPTAGDFIFVTPRGRPWVGNGPGALKRLYEALERAGIPRVDARGEKVDIHSLRHTFASRLARSGVGLVQAQKLLGHSDPKLTASIYSHLDADDLRSAVEGLPALKAARG